jgi:hypothetical protein
LRPMVHFILAVSLYLVAPSENADYLRVDPVWSPIAPMRILCLRSRPRFRPRRGSNTRNAWRF